MTPLLLSLALVFFFSITLINGHCHDEDDKKCLLPRSCNDWYKLGINKSCFYPIYPHGNTTKQQMVYCDMQGSNCDGKGGWTRVAFLNMMQAGATCSSGLKQIKYSTIDHDLCGFSLLLSGGCSSTSFPSAGVRYTEVCGRVRGYQFGTPDSFYEISTGIESYYVDGVSITHGKNPRQHIWTYAGVYHPNTTGNEACPCSNGGNSLGSFVGNHHYCESGIPADKGWSDILYPNDPLWDGKQCDGHEVPCCTNPKLPWFYRKLNIQTKDDIELRVCSNFGAERDHTPIDIIELFIR